MHTRPLTVVMIAAAAWSCATTAPAPQRMGAFAGADTVRLHEIAPGVTHTFVHDRRGPWAIHVVEIDTTRCRPALAARTPGPPLSARASTSTLAAGTLVTINADFFMLPGGTPVGAHVTRGVPLIGPTDRQVFATESGGWRIGIAHLAGTAAVRTDTVRMTQLNRPGARFSAYRGTTDGVALFTRWIGDTVPADSGALRVRLRALSGNEAQGRGVVVAVDSATAPVSVGVAEAVLHAYGPAHAWARRRTTGDTVTWRAAVRVQDAAQEAVGGFPELLRGGRAVLHEQEVRAEFGARRHPRTALGWRADGSLLLVVVDGRQPPWSDGMSLAELTWLFQSLGATDALNLDGGGSTAMVVRGTLVNRPSDREGERPVGNALALEHCGA